MIDRFIIVTRSSEGGEESNEKENVGISSLVIPAFGTGVISHLEAGNLIRIAIQHFFELPEYINPSMVQARHEAIHYGGRYGYEHPRPIAQRWECQAPCRAL